LLWLFGFGRSLYYYIVILLADEHHGLIKRLFYGLMHKHIAGSTTASAIKTVHKVNDKGMRATVTFLNEHVKSAPKARYNINAYIQLVKTISRLSMKSDVSLRLTQLGYSLNHEIAADGFSEILAAAESSNCRLWLEHENNIEPSELIGFYKDLMSRSTGIEMPLAYVLENGHLSREARVLRAVKLTAYGYEAKEGVLKRKHQKDLFAMYSDAINRLMHAKPALTVLCQDERLVDRLALANKGYKRNLTFELPLGYNNKRVNMLMKRHINLSAYVAYGKDWLPYAINRLTEGRIRDIAVAILDNERVD